MNNVNKITPYTPFQETQTKIQHSQSGPKHRPDAVTSARKDYTDLSSEWGTKDSVQALLDELLTSFRKNYPDLDIFITDPLDKEALPDTAASLGDGTHLLLSREFIEEMKSSHEAYKKGKSILLRLLGQLSPNHSNTRAQGVYVGKSEALFWSAGKPPEKPQNPLDNLPDTMVPSQNGNHTAVPSPIDQLWKLQEDAQKTYSEIYKSKTKVSLHAISSSYASLSVARTKGQVQSVLADTRRNIANLRLASSFGDDEERMKARAAIASMQKLLQRGGRKIRRLNEEELVRLRQKRAQRLQEQRKALLLKLEREMMRAKRQSADGAIKKEGELEELNQAMRFSRHSKYNPYEKLISPPTIPELPGAGAGAPAVDTPAASAPLAAADISITSVSIEF